MAAKASNAVEEQAESFSDQSEVKPIMLPGRAPLDLQTKVVIAALGVCGMAIVGLAVWLLQYRITHPFTVTIHDVLSPSTSTISSEAKIVDLKSKDTDGDTLTDYDEIYVYGTSPYLRDTDSDGIDDGTEVKRGSDPNCDQKQGACTGIRFINPEVKISDLLPQFSPTNVTLKNATLSQFRKILLDSGMSADALATLDDRQLFAAMDAIVSYDQQDPIDVNSLDEKDIRQFLVDAGVSKTEVDRMSPDDLKNLISTLVQ